MRRFTTLHLFVLGAFAALEACSSDDAFDVPDSGLDGEATLPAYDGSADARSSAPDAARDVQAGDATVDAALDAPSDAGADTMTEASLDAAPDAATDASLDASADAALDAMLDAAVDASADAALDVAVDASPDATPDASADASPDATPDADPCATWSNVPDVPDALKVPPSSGGVLLHARGVGSQVYACAQVSSDGGLAYVWAKRGPEADLRDCNNVTIGTHFSSAAADGGVGDPTWRDTNGRYVAGTVQSSVSVRTDAIPWLLLLGVRGTSGTGAPFDRTSSIQRVDTVGGLPPAGNCSVPGQVIRVPYEADYYFYGP